MFDIRNVISAILSTFGITALIFFVASADSLPLWILLVVAVILWITLLVFTLRKTEEPTLWISKDGQWVAMDKSGRTEPIDPKTYNSRIYDNEENR